MCGLACLRASTTLCCKVAHQPEKTHDNPLRVPADERSLDAQVIKAARRDVMDEAVAQPKALA